jgi:hypothetical protein
MNKHKDLMESAQDNADYFGVSYVVFSDSSGNWRSERESSFFDNVPTGAVIVNPTYRNRVGFLAKRYASKRLPLQVLVSAAGYYIGTEDDEGPVSRESLEYWLSREQAEKAFEDGDWTQHDHP